jgi:SAM-dependent methyltransferase
MAEPGAVALIQAHHTDLLDHDADPAHYVVGALAGSREVDRIVVAVADLPENAVFRELAAAWGVDVFFGSELDVVDRLLGAARLAGAAGGTPLARVLLNRFYVDAGLVDRSIELLRDTGSDFVLLPYDFDINFGADVFTLSCLERVDRLTRGGDAHTRFRPWLFIEEHPEHCRVVTNHDIPSYPRRRLEEIRSSGLFSQRDCGTFSDFTYRLIRDDLDREDVVLDLACGSGDGTALLAERCRHVRGADLSAETVAAAREAHKRPNLAFDVQDGLALTYEDGAFSTVVSSNTLEHVTDDRLLLENFQRVLRPDGRLVLETPLVRRRPFNFPVLSSHLREYEKAPLVELLRTTGFEPERKFGMNRGVYVDWSRAREAVLIHARKR